MLYAGSPPWERIKSSRSFEKITNSVCPASISSANPKGTFPCARAARSFVRPIRIPEDARRSTASCVVIVRGFKAFPSLPFISQSPQRAKAQESLRAVCPAVFLTAQSVCLLEHQFSLLRYLYIFRLITSQGDRPDLSFTLHSPVKV